MVRKSRMALALIALVCLWSLAAFFGVGGSAGRPPQGQGGPGAGAAAKYVPDEVLVRFAPGVPQHVEASAHAAVGAGVLKRFQIVEGLALVKLPPGRQVKEAIALYRQQPTVLYAEPNFTVEAVETFPNDTSFNQLWGLLNTGQSGGTPGADIQATKAWDLTTGSSGVGLVVAVIDTGIDYTHPDLSSNMFRNAAECNGTRNVDDDANGYTDDCYGFDFVNGDGDPTDDHYHGTHVAGTIGAVGNNGKGVVGVNWTVGLMACKFLNASGSGTTAGAISCLDYVKKRKDQGANIVATNNSWGGGGFAQSLYDAIDVHRQKGILFIAAAGNSALDNDTALFYPASYYLPNVISVAATTRTDDRASFSNYGPRTVHLGAPGTDILSTTPGNKYGTLSGTSMATPHVTGVAALLKAKYPSLDWTSIKNLILAGGESKDSLTNATITGKRLNAYGALECSNSTVRSRLRPIGNTVTASADIPIKLAALHINCAAPGGPVTMTVNAAEPPILLQDEGNGVYSGQWTPGGPGVYTLTFLAGNTAFDEVTVQVLQNYNVAGTNYAWRAIGDTNNLNLGDDTWAKITPGFPISFGGGSFSELYISSNGNLNFIGPHTAYINTPLPTSAVSTLVAPFWDDLYPPSSEQNVFWEVRNSSPRELVIEWRNVRHFTCNGDSSAIVSFQVVFFEGRSDVLFNYADTKFSYPGAVGCAFADNGGSATVGVQVGSTSATQFSYNTASLGDGTALLWTLALPGPDNSPPTITITTPTASSTYSTNTSPLILGGTAGDNVGVTQVTWTNDRGGNGTATGTTNWTVNGITLQNGTNLLTVTAHDAAGHLATDTLEVLLDQTPPIDGNLNATAGNAKVTLSWSSFSDEGSGLASTNPYKLVFSTGGYPAASCTSGTPLYSGSATSFTHTKLKNGLKYSYRVCARDDAGNISAGVTADATPQGGKGR